MTARDWKAETDLRNGILHEPDNLGGSPFSRQDHAVGQSGDERGVLFLQGDHERVVDRVDDDRSLSGLELEDGHCQSCPRIFP